MSSEDVTLLKLLPSSLMASTEQRSVLDKKSLSENLVAPPPRSPEPPDPPLPPDLLTSPPLRTNRLSSHLFRSMNVDGFEFYFQTISSTNTQLEDWLSDARNLVEERNISRLISLQYATNQSYEDWLLMVKVWVVLCFVGVLSLPMCFHGSQLRVAGSPWHHRPFLSSCLRLHLIWRKIRDELPDAFRFASITSDMSGVSLYSCTIFKPVCPTASVYRVHLAHYRDAALDFVSLSFQLSQASRVYTVSALFLVSFGFKSRQLRSFSIALGYGSTVISQLLWPVISLYFRHSLLLLASAAKSSKPQIIEVKESLAQTLEFPILRVFSDHRTLIRAISSNTQSKEIMGIVKDIRSISSKFANILFSHFLRFENFVVVVLAKWALQAHFFMY